MLSVEEYREIKRLQAEGRKTFSENGHDVTECDIPEIDDWVATFNSWKPSRKRYALKLIGVVPCDG